MSTITLSTRKSSKFTMIYNNIVPFIFDEDRRYNEYNKISIKSNIVKIFDINSSKRFNGSFILAMQQSVF